MYAFWEGAKSVHPFLTYLLWAKQKWGVKAVNTKCALSWSWEDPGQLGGQILGSVGGVGQGFLLYRKRSGDRCEWTKGKKKKQISEVSEETWE